MFLLRVGAPGPHVSQGGVKSLLAFWAGGGGAATGIAPVKHPGWAPEWPVQTPAEAEREWQLSHGHLREKLRLEEAAQAALKASQATRSEERKEALEEAAQVALEAVDEAPQESIVEIARLLDAAVSAQRVAQSVKQARAAIAIAKAAHDFQAAEQDEEEALMLLLQ